MKITAKDIESIAIGSTFLGTGGGGDPYIGKLLVQEVIEKYGDITLLSAHEIPDDVLVIPVAAFGAPMILLEKLFAGHEFFNAFEMMQKYLGKKAFAIMPIEAGGLNGVIPFAVAAKYNLPIIDADGMGRAFPRLEMVTFTLHGIPAAPIAQADEKGNQVIYHSISNIWGETLLGSTVIPMGGSCAVCCYPLTGAQVKKAAIKGVLSFAKKIGEHILQAKGNSANALASLIAVSGAHHLFSGKIHQISMTTEGRWNKGVCLIKGLHQNENQEMTIDFQNEFLMAKKEGKLLAVTPDLIIMVDLDTGNPLTAESIKYGNRVAILALPCDQQWRTPEGVLLAGPEKFGYVEKYIPVENLLN